MTTQHDERAELIRDLDYIWGCIYDHGAGKFKGPISKAQRDNAYEKIEKIKAALLQADAKVGWEVVAVHDKDQPNGIAWCPGNPEALADITALYTRPQQAAQASPWQPIETAPKDGTMFLAWVAAERWSSLDGESSSYAHDTSQMDFCWWREGLDGNGYFDPACGQIGDLQDITHWMPLPEPPKSNE